jgi:hypothetical protein
MWAPIFFDARDEGRAFDAVEVMGRERVVRTGTEPQKHHRNKSPHA